MKKILLILIFFIVTSLVSAMQIVNQEIIGVSINESFNNGNYNDTIWTIQDGLDTVTDASILNGKLFIEGDGQNIPLNSAMFFPNSSNQILNKTNYYFKFSVFNSSSEGGLNQPFFILQRNNSLGSIETTITNDTKCVLINTTGSYDLQCDRTFNPDPTINCAGNTSYPFSYDYNVTIILHVNESSLQYKLTDYNNPFRENWIQCDNKILNRSENEFLVAGLSANTGTWGFDDIEYCAESNWNETNLSCMQKNPQVPPEITLSNPINNTNFTNEFNVKFNYTALDNNSYDLLNCSIVINNIVNITNVSIIPNSLINNYVLFQLNNATYNYSINCSDGANITTTPISYFRINNPEPIVVSSLGYTASANNIYLAWAYNPESDIINYSIYRSDTLTGDYTLLARTTANNYDSGGYTEGTHRFFKISAEDSLHQFGLNSTILEGVTVGGGGSIIIVQPGGGGGGAITTSKNTTECSVFIKYPSNKILILKYLNPNETLKSSVEICNQNNIPVNFRYNFNSDLQQYCNLPVSQDTLPGSSCRKVEFNCKSSDPPTQGRLIVSRDSAENEVLIIPSCQDNILISNGYYSFWDYLVASKLLIPGIIGVIIIVIAVVYLIIDLRGKGR